MYIFCGTGEWILPCLNCADTLSCDWSKAQWQPTTCTYAKMSLAALKKCLRSKKVYQLDYFYFTRTYKRSSIGCFFFVDNVLLFK